MTIPQLTLNDGVQIPQLGFGVWRVGSDEILPSLAKAFEVGYRHVDTATIYGNEEGVGQAIAESGLAREDLFITTKLWNDSHAPDLARKAIELSLTKLGLDYLDLYLIHWPQTAVGGDLYRDAWDSLQQFKAEGLVRSIGVSNFSPVHLDAIHGTTPSVNQVELHPSWNQHRLREVHAVRGIATESWSPLGNGRFGNNESASDLELPDIVAIAEEIGRTPAQVILRWHLQSGFIVIPKSVTPARIEQNFAVTDFELSEDQLQRISALDSGKRQGPDPEECAY